MKRRLMAAVVIGFVAVGMLIVGLRTRPFPPVQKLAWDGVVDLAVGGHPVTIETRSRAHVPADKGPAQIIISTGEARSVLDSHFDDDNWMDIRPGYLSWQAVDGSPGDDLLIWKPAGRAGLLAADYISSADGKLHPLPEPIYMDYDLSDQWLP